VFYTFCCSKKSNRFFCLKKGLKIYLKTNKKMNVFVNGNKVKVHKKSTVLQACEKVNVTVPQFCYHERLQVAGNCRICLVEIENIIKPVASCSMPVAENIIIFTDTPKVKKAQEAVLEFLLINHPLDCPVCDQGGECDLQNQATKYGTDKSRFFEKKRSVISKDVSPLINTVITRCIHCTRCVRFLNKVGGETKLGMVGRGYFSEIGTFEKNKIQSFLSGNIIDLCPVGYFIDIKFK